MGTGSPLSHFAPHPDPTTPPYPTGPHPNPKSAPLLHALSNLSHSRALAVRTDDPSEGQRVRIRRRGGGPGGSAQGQRWGAPGRAVPRRTQSSCAPSTLGAAWGLTGDAGHTRAAAKDPGRVQQGLGMADTPQIHRGRPPRAGPLTLASVHLVCELVHPVEGQCKCRTRRRVRVGRCRG